MGINYIEKLAKPEELKAKYPVTEEMKLLKEKRDKEIKDILSGKEQGAKRNIVLMNAGATLYIGGKADTMEEGIQIAADAIDSGKALKTLEALVTESNK